uniref:Uncharacterized protein n=1 Tax=Cryptomonas curvata TaxID=233186 RepID=A0A7S0LWA9_9CRYP|mmetsp:Transcript_10658/g.22823  ORF Transcript_10658/g.22823 Transcript_10658/m.22823 type:complete len:195 (+) Transcript_10658:3-587(+)
MARPTVAFKPRPRLTQSQAIDIFKMKNTASSAVKIAVYYEVSEKAVRDIWTGRTWSMETYHLDTARTVVLKQIGRPRGCRDQKPRKRRVDNSVGIRKAIKSSASSSQQGQEIMNSWFEQMNHGKQESQSDCSNTLTERFLTLISVDNPKESSQSPSCAARVDELLTKWNETLWINSRNPDPFRDDWAPTTCPSV